jgi:alpha-beta hydrolase superfamily lysophospholipase
MTAADDYRGHAAHCARMAERSVKSDDKMAWLKLAQSWLGMAQEADGSLLPAAPVAEPVITLPAGAEPIIAPVSAVKPESPPRAFDPRGEAE